MTARCGLAAAVAAGLLAACTIHGEDADQPLAAAGGDYARARCASCHAVAAGAQTSPNPAAPAFQALADRADMSRVGLAALLRTPHRSMPDLIVAPADADALYAYLESIRT
jgi:mono/diheme cytochrome c family protein